MESGVPTVTEFFGRATAAAVVAEHGHPRLVAANNVMAHVPDLHDFVAGLAVLADDDTVITVENPSLMSLLTETQFDTIYHEHYSYLTAHAVRTVVSEHGLDLVRVDQLPTHGGSNRYWIRRTGEPDASVVRTLAEEARLGLFDDRLWQAFAARSHAAIDGLRDWLDERAAAGRTVAGYGAAAKGNTFLNAVGDAAGTLRYVVDGSAEKQGRFLPGSRVPVLAPAALAQDAGRRRRDPAVEPGDRTGRAGPPARAARAGVGGDPSDGAAVVRREWSELRDVSLVAGRSTDDDRGSFSKMLDAGAGPGVTATQVCVSSNHRRGTVARHARAGWRRTSRRSVCGASPERCGTCSSTSGRANRPTATGRPCTSRQSSRPC